MNTPAVCHKSITSAVPKNVKPPQSWVMPVLQILSPDGHAAIIYHAWVMTACVCCPVQLLTIKVSSENDRKMTC